MSILTVIIWIASKSLLQKFVFVCRHVWLFVSCVVVCAMCGCLCHVWLFVPCVVVCVMCGSLCHVWLFVSCVVVCAMCGCLCHVWLFVPFVVVCVTWNEGASAKCLNRCSTCILIQPLHFYEISRHYCICLCWILLWKWPIKAETCKSFTTCLYIIVQKCSAVVAVYMAT